MPFLVNDIYTSSGSDFIYNNWNAHVTKFDTSSFYNWEQDNEPIHDLEERTYLNWEHAGFHTSSVPGMVFTVSADTPAAILVTSSNIFTTVSAAIEAIPSNLRFPLLIEIANFDALGELNLKDINIGYGGSLEIINRNFVKAYAASAGVGGFAERSCAIADLSDKNLKYRMINQVSSADISGTWNDASAMNIKTKVLAHADGDARLAGKINSVFQPFASNLTTRNMAEQETSRLSVSITGDFLAAANKWSLPLFEETVAATLVPHLINSYDVSARDILSVDEGELITGNGVADNGPAQGMLYGNYLTRLRVNNCNGPIYIRNFFINSSDHAGDGVQVFNSNDIWLEDCASINNKVGFNFRNSKVYVNRGIVAYRNYGVDASHKRKSGDWSGINEGRFAPASRFVDDGAGLRAHNSEIVLNNASSVTGRQSLDNEPYAAFGVHAHQNEFMINFSRNSFGVVLENSILHGGMASGNDTSYASGLHFNVELNNDYGIHARNSTIDLDGRLKVYSNARGILLENSKAYLNEWAVRGNQHEGIHALNSNIQYNKNITSMAFDNSPNSLEYQFDCSGNGTHLILDEGSTIMPTLTSAMPSYYGQMRFRDHHGLNVTTSGSDIATPVSPIQVRNNSNAVLVHPVINSFSNIFNLAGFALSGNPIYGECISIRNNSRVTTKGSVNGATVIFGSDDTNLDNEDAYNTHKNSAGVYVEDNSSFECNGPTVLYNFGVDVLADSNSVMRFRPHTTPNSSEIDASGWALSDEQNHTSVELHSLNSCLVARNNSTINMRDLGDYNACWGSTNRSSPDYPTGELNITSSGLDTSAYTKAGSMQFYPNPIGLEYYKNTPDAKTEPTGRIADSGTYVFRRTGVELMNIASTAEDSFKRNYYLDVQPFTENGMFNTKYTAGGTCLRALGGSQVDVLNVNFPTGWWNPSGIIYDVSGAEKGSPGSLCNRTFIWNIADDSKLHAAFCSVSGNDPRNMGYHGPSSVYFVPGGTTAELGSIATARAPSGTPHTSSLSVLDFHGMGRKDILPVPQFSSMLIGQVAASLARPFLPLQLSAPLGDLMPYGTTGTSLQNRGPFRLYVSVDPMVNTFSSIDANNHLVVDDGMHRQIYAQGYNLSGPVSAGPMTLSATYGHALRVPIATEGNGQHGAAMNSFSGLSGFVYNNEVVDPTTYTRIQLDESAAHIFANAKNGAMGTSNRAKICSIYVSRGAVGGEAAALSSHKTFGRGYTSPNIFGLGRRE